MNQRNLFDDDQPSKRKHHVTPTSRNAAESMQCAAERQGERILEFIRARGPRGATREEIEQTLRMSGNSTRPRCKELLKRGAIKLADFKRPTAAGRDAEVLVVCERSTTAPNLAHGSTT